MSEQTNPRPGPEFIAEHEGPEVYMPLTPELRTRSHLTLTETIRRILNPRGGGHA